MNTLSINSKTALLLARATERARKLKPRVRKTPVYGVYEVEASDKSKWYIVTCISATKEITCNCKSTHPCYHVSTIAPIHSYIARQRRDEAVIALVEATIEAANWPLPSQTVNEVPTFFATEDEAERAAQEAAPALPPVEVARAQAEQALVALEKSWPVSEIEEFIAENSASLDRHCPVCGLVQPDNDNTDCWACGAALNPDDIDPTLCECGKPGFSHYNNRWHCIGCIKALEAKEAITCKDCQAPATGSEGRCTECQLIKDSADLFGTPAPVLSFTRRERVKEAW